MKKILLITFLVLLLVSCGNKIENGEKEIVKTGKITDSSKKYLSKGYILNISSHVDRLSDEIKDMGKGHVNMVFRVLVNYDSNINYKDENQYIKKQIVSNVKIKKAPIMGTIGNIYGSYNSYQYEDFIIDKTNDKYVREYDKPVIAAEQNSIAIAIDKVAFIDSAKYKDNITSDELFGLLGITRDNVAIVISFRIELYTVDEKSFYKDYEIEIPAKDFVIKNGNYETKFITDDKNEMEPFFEK